MAQMCDCMHACVCDYVYVYGRECVHVRLRACVRVCVCVHPCNRSTLSSRKMSHV